MYTVAHIRGKDKGRDLSLYPRSTPPQLCDLEQVLDFLSYGFIFCKRQMVVSATELWR